MSHIDQLVERLLGETVNVKIVGEEEEVIQVLSTDIPLLKKMLRNCRDGAWSDELMDFVDDRRLNIDYVVNSYDNTITRVE